MTTIYLYRYYIALSTSDIERSIVRCNACNIAVLCMQLSSDLWLMHITKMIHNSFDSRVINVKITERFLYRKILFNIIIVFS